MLLSAVSESEECIHAMRALECITPLVGAMRTTPPLCSLAIPALTNLMSCTDLVEKALTAQLVPFMLALLAGGLEQCDDPSAVKAHSVRLLKKMAADERFGPTVAALLDEDRTWDAFKMQEHDLFLGTEGNAGLLAHNNGPRVGLLTQQ